MYPRVVLPCLRSALRRECAVGRVRLVPACADVRAHADTLSSSSSAFVSASAALSVAPQNRRVAWLGAFSALLIWRNSNQIARNLTTNEVLHWARYKYLHVDQMTAKPFDNPFDAGSSRANCMWFWAPLVHGVARRTNVQRRVRSACSAARQLAKDAISDMREQRGGDAALPV